MTPQETGAALNGSPLTDTASPQQVEAAHYAVLRRVAPCLRHHMVRPLQPIGLIYGVMQHKLAADEPDLESIRMEADKINVFAKAALEECADMATWLAPEPGVLVEFGRGVSECAGLIATMLHFCGFRLINSVDEPPVLVHRNALRMVLIASLLETTDSLEVPATLTLTSTLGEHEAVVLLEVSETEGGCVERYDDGYRKLVWADVQALALSENVGLTRETGRITLRFAVAQKPAVH